MNIHQERVAKEEEVKHRKVKQEQKVKKEKLMQCVKGW